MPEQFTEEWENIKQTPATAINTSKDTAGNYSWRSNLFQVALIMACVITGATPQHPPRPTRVNLKINCPGPRHGDEISGTTYGWYLVYGKPPWCHIDFELRRVLAHCMMNRPVDRPSMREVYDMCRNRVQAYQMQVDLRNPGDTSCNNLNPFPTDSVTRQDDDNQPD
ncbi:hypothetical protein QBC38DRAFT_516766 [Podospora fimiseda]|uniref:Uncharacterized protein n=1 Tax=Podospora fimiseda TaxID=252190 RepID=A0AAN7BHP1_9PEZI|nr:hypothetical protein QBC38DRAFT_516766 [Podospora fimiseda]